jgi:hypothetical protein
MTDMLTILASYGSHTLDCMFEMTKERQRSEEAGRFGDASWTTRFTCVCGFRDVLAHMGISEREANAIAWND